MLGDRQGPSESFLDPGLETLIAGVGPHERDGGEQEVEEAEQEHAAGLVMDVGRVNLCLQQIALGIDQHRPLAAHDLFAAVIAARAAGLRGLDRLAVDHRRGRLGLAPPGDPVTLAQDLVDPLPSPLPPPFAQMIVDILPGRKIMRHHAPRNTAAQDVEAGLDDPPQAVVLLMTTPLLSAQQWFDQCPLLVAQVRGIRLLRHDPSSCVPVGRSTESTQKGLQSAYAAFKENLPFFQLNTLLYAFRIEALVEVVC